jgi:Methyltransferase domain
MLSFPGQTTMKRLLKKAFAQFGYEVSRKSPPPLFAGAPSDIFHSFKYLRHNARRLEHLASLRIPVARSTVLEVGAGIGDHSGYYLDRGCAITITEARQDNLRVLADRYPGERIAHLDLENPQPLPGMPFDVVHCYGLLYHLGNPAAALQFLAEHCRRILFLETCVSFGDDKSVHLVAEQITDPTQAVSGTGCRPTRPWLFEQLQLHFPHVYCPITQPNHDEFPLDWTAPKQHQAKHGHGLVRAVFVASRSPLQNDQLSPHLLDTQSAHP